MHGLEKSDCCVVAMKWANKYAKAEVETTKAEAPPRPNWVWFSPTKNRVFGLS
jgi:hypothetical protein